MTLFEYLGSAGQERIHTQTLAWLLTPSTSPLTVAHRVAILRALKVDCTDADAEVLRVQTELFSLDMICSAPGVLLVLENKLKSRQSYRQLSRYDEVIPKVQDLFGPNDKLRKVFLTLSHEKAGSNRPGEWTNIDYSALLQPMATAATDTNNPYVSDYASLLSRMVKARDAFISNPGAFPAVVDRVSWSAEKRLKSPLPADTTDEERFVCNNRLERIFIETLLRNLVNEVGNAVIDSGARGMPLVQVPLYLVQLDPGVWYEAGFQLQDKRLKLTIAHIDYKTSSRNEKEGFHGNRFLKLSGGRESTEGKTRDYHSWIWPAPPELIFDQNTGVCFSSAFAKEVTAAQNVWGETLKPLVDNNELVSFELWTSARAEELVAA